MGMLEDMFEGSRKRGFGRGRDHHDDDDHGFDHGRPQAEWQGGMSQAQFPSTSCAGCRATVAMMPGFRFCPYCGGALSVEPSCRACGAKAVAGAAFCHGCGAKM